LLGQFRSVEIQASLGSTGAEAFHPKQFSTRRAAGYIASGLFIRPKEKPQFSRDISYAIHD
jgi:hypothetical protein